MLSVTMCGQVESLKSRLHELSGQLEGSNSLKSWNAELLKELAGLRWEC